ncbi:hypothetical protein RSOLAG22IIIB_12845 [Rhizoctonia solani]|uniref:Uncharacterized protein n=1 Tax=Rhizoctonia solani TaxID=456999 RepID=A0A0K6GGR4_9AGAM|nr:hypothetical protein RSOLAG22IIIB_12845 [Rhizoctonia solani]
MGKRSPAVSRAGVFSVMFSTITTLLSFIMPPTANPNPTVGKLRTDKSQHRELIEFGEYVDRLVQQLVLALGNDQVARQANVVENLEALQKILLSILQRISNINDAGGLTSRRHILFPEEDYISQMRQQLDDALSAFQFGAVLRLLSEGQNPRVGSTATNQPKPRQSETPKPCHSPSPEHSRQVAQPAKPIQDNHSIHPHLDAQPSTQRAKPQPTPLTAHRSSSETGEISLAFMDVERCRNLLRHSHSPSRTVKLANALWQLSILLGEAGRTLEALEASQEAAELYRSIAEKPN